MTKYVIKNLDEDRERVIRIYSLDDNPTSVFSNDFTKLTETEKVYGITLINKPADPIEPIADFVGGVNTSDAISGVIVNGDEISDVNSIDDMNTALAPSNVVVDELPEY